MADPLTWIAVGGMALAGAGTSFMEARQAEDAAKAQERYRAQVQGAQKKAARVQERQIEQQATLERARAADRANLIRSRIRAAAGESGIGLGGTYQALRRQVTFDELLNRQIITRNALLNIRRAWSGIGPVQPVPEPPNALLAAFMGGLGGAQAGLSLRTQIAGMKTQKPLPTLPPIEQYWQNPLPTGRQQLPHLPSNLRR